MIQAESFIEAATARGFGLYAGVPCSYLTPFINYTISSDRLLYIGAVNEGDAVAIAAGAELGGLRSIVMFQNSGLGNAINPLTSLTHTFRIPVLVIVTWRGEPGGTADEPQHELMGQITPRLLDLMGIPWRPFPTADADIAATLDQATAWMSRERRPFALVMSKGSVAEAALAPAPGRDLRRRPPGTASARARASRQMMLRAIQAAAKADDIIVATTGYTGRELAALADRPSQFYMVGSMGCAASLGLGLAVARPAHRVIVVDGDGAALMRLGAFATLGYQRPENLLHVLLDNGQHESTGGQATVSANVDFCAIAAAAGYPKVMAVGDADQVREEVAWRSSGLRFIHVPVVPGVQPDLPRPSLQPPAVAARLRAWLGPRP